MRHLKTAACLLTLLTAALAFSANAKSANADTLSMYTKTYKVQVEYWFFDTDYYYWSTILETHNKNDAQVLYDALRVAKEHGFLNEAAANSYWRYIAVDVRLKTEYHYPQIQPAPLNPLYSKSFQLKR